MCAPRTREIHRTLHAVTQAMKILAILEALALSFALTIQTENLGDSDNDNIAVSQQTNTLQTELQSMGILNHDFTQEFIQQDADGVDGRSDRVFVIPRNQITERVLNRLGFKDLVKYLKRFKLQNPLFSSHSDIIIPENTVPYFLFNTSDHINIPKSHSRLEHAQFLDQSAPFQLPKFSALVDYLLVILMPRTFKHQHMKKDVIIARSESLPLFAHAIKSGVPLLMFMFRSGDRSFNGSNEFGIPLSGVDRQELNKFFDVFAQTWTQSINFLGLLHGVFCTVNVESKKNSFCLKIKDDMDNLVLFPPFDRYRSHIDKRDRSPAYHGFTKSDKRLLLQKRDERLDDLSHSSTSPAQNCNHVASDLTIPLSLVKEAASDGQKAYSSRSSGYSQMNIRGEPSLSQRSRTSYGDGHDLTNAKVEPKIRPRLADRLLTKKIKDKKIKDKKIKESADTYVQNSHMKKNNVGADKDTQQRGTNRRFSVIKNSSTDGGSRGEFTIPEMYTYDSQEIVAEWNDKMKRQRQADKQLVVKLQSSATSNTTAETTTHGAGGSKDCEPITWFNVFHHSVFGKTKFCGI